MAVSYRTQGFILTKNDLREADQVFDVFTKDFGKIKILGKAIRKINSKLRAGIDIFYLSEIEFIQGKNYKTLTDASVVNKFEDIRKDFNKMEITQKISEAAVSLIKGEEADEKIWGLFTEVFDNLGNCQPKAGPPRAEKLEMFYYYFLWTLLSVLGYQIDLYNCAKCQEGLIPEIMNFSAELNGIICLRCSFDSIKDKFKISPETVKILRVIQKGDWAVLKKIKIQKDHLKELESISESYLKVLSS